MPAVFSSGDRNVDSCWRIKSGRQVVSETKRFNHEWAVVPEYTKWSQDWSLSLARDERDKALNLPRKVEDKNKHQDEDASRVVEG